VAADEPWAALHYSNGLSVLNTTLSADPGPWAFFPSVGRALGSCEERFWQSVDSGPRVPPRETGPVWAGRSPYH